MSDNVDTGARVKNSDRNRDGVNFGGNVGARSTLTGHAGKMITSATAKSKEAVASGKYSEEEAKTAMTQYTKNIVSALSLLNKNLSKDQKIQMTSEELVAAFSIALKTVRDKTQKVEVVNSVKVSSKGSVDKVD